MRSSLRSLAALALLAAPALVACGGDLASSSADATDTFARPTMHGELLFGVASTVTFTDEERFHAWTFTLTGDADVELVTENLVQNLDTVAYLYRREPGTQSWGTARMKNDDHGGKLASRLAGPLGAGEYLVKVKASKTPMRGSFDLRGTCSGAGCPTTEDVACEVGTEVSTPSEQGYSLACSHAVAAILAEPVTGQGSESLRPESKCDAGGLAGRAIDFYRQYWGSSWEELFYDPEEGTIEVGIVRHGALGTVVSIDLGGDEDNVRFVFDGESELVAFFHSEQSSTTTWTCTGQTGPAAEPPPDHCLGAAMWALEGGASATTRTGSFDANDPATLGGYAPVVARLLERGGVEADPRIDFTLETWRTLDGSEAARLELTAELASASYLLGDGMVIFAAEETELLGLVCEEY